MKIKFLDGNTPQEEYEVNEGSTITQCKNETLDTAFIIISNTSDILDLQPLDRCVLIDTENRFENIYMCIESIEITEICINPKIYRYDIHLISETKSLEGYLLPNLTITPSSQNLTINDYISRYLELYGPKYRVNVNGNIIWRNRLATDTETVYNKFNSIECPEMQWNEPNLREVLNDLMMIADCIPVVRNNILYAMDLTEEGNNISENTHINYVRQSRSLEDYVSELKMNLINGMPEENEGTNHKVKRIEMVPYTSESDYFVNSENIILRTEFPILKVLSLQMYFGYILLNYNNRAWTVGSTGADLCDFNGVNGVFEEKQYRTLNRLISDSVISSNISLSNYGKYQNFAVYYSRGSNEIRGFSDTTERRLAWISEKYTTNTILKSLIMRSKFPVAIVDLSTGSFQNTFFIIEYETTANAVFSASKSEYPRHKRNVIDHQTNSYVNTYRQGFLEYQKANRLGNLVKQINARYEDDYENLIKIGDVYNDSIIYQCQYQIYKNHIEVNAQATKGYILRDYFTGIKAKLRSWKIVDGAEAAARHDLIKYYCELSYSSYNEVGIVSLSDFSSMWPTINDEIYFAKYFCSPLLNDQTYNPIKTCGMVFNTRLSGNIPLWTNTVYAVEVCPAIIGNSLNFTFGCQDNFGVEKVANLDTNYITFPTGGTDQNDHGFPVVTGSIGGIPLKDLRYVDGNGEFSTVYLLFGSNINKGEETTFGGKVPIMGEYLYGQDNLIVRAYSDNEIAETYKNYYKQNECTLDQITNISLYDKVQLYKDNKEIMKLSYQFEFCTDSQDIQIGKAMLKRQKAIRTVGTNDINIKVGTNIIGTSQNISLNDSGTTCCQIHFTFTYIIPAGTLIEVKDAVTDELIFSFIKQVNNNYEDIYLNFLKDRDKSIYDN